MFGVEYGVERVAAVFLGVGMFALWALIWWVVFLPGRRFLEAQRRLADPEEFRRQVMEMEELKEVARIRARRRARREDRGGRTG